MATQDTPNIPELLGFNGLVVNWLNVKYRPTLLSQFINDLTFSSGGVQVNSDWNAITGAPAGSLNEPFILLMDLHYQSNSIMGTKDKNFPFYT